jgi:Tfp pilus assembly protein PilV
MLSLLCSKKGMGMVEVMIAMFLTTVAVVSILSMMPLSWRTAGKADYLGRAAGILQTQLELCEGQIMRNNIPALGTTTRDVQVSDPFTVSAGIRGDATMTLRTTISRRANNSWMVTVNVIWPGNPQGLTNSIIATPQMFF